MKFQDNYTVEDLTPDQNLPPMKRFFVALPMGNAGAELSRVNPDPNQPFRQIISHLHSNDISNQEWYDFTRLLVPQGYRGDGIGTKIMKAVVSWADTNQVNIFNTVNDAYLTDPDSELPRLIEFYSSFGFIDHGKKLMSRLYEI